MLCVPHRFDDCATAWPGTEATSPAVESRVLLDVLALMLPQVTHPAPKWWSSQLIGQWPLSVYLEKIPRSSALVYIQEVSIGLKHNVNLTSLALVLQILYL